MSFEGFTTPVDSEDEEMLIGSGSHDGWSSPLIFGSYPPSRTGHINSAVVDMESLSQEERESSDRTTDPMIDEDYSSIEAGLGLPYGDKKPGIRSRSHSVTSLIDVGRIVPVYLSWSHLCVTVKTPAKKKFFSRRQESPALEKTILKNANGIVSPGTLLAIIGASGSGKSTLLNTLTSRNTKDYTITGDISVNGWKIGEGIKHISAYVQQNDLFMSTLTVREQLQFRAMLRMDKNMSQSDRVRRVEGVITQMGLQGCANTRIGNPSGEKKGISGGERKRLSFASEVLTNPPILFCDEPTSSLDTFMAQSVVHILRKLATEGRTVLCTIHQPSSELFTMFDHILLLSEGRVAFMGSSDEAIPFFNRLGYPCPVNFNPADHYIMTMAVVPGKEGESRAKIKAICDHFANSDHAHTISRKTDELVTSAESIQTTTHLDMAAEIKDSEQRYKSSWFRQFGNLFMRNSKMQIRDSVLFNVRIMQSVSVALILGLIYLQLSIDQKGVQNINGALYLLIANISLANMFAVLSSFPDEMAIIMREYGTGLYRMDTYYLTKTLSEIPLFSAICVLFASITYWMIGFQNDFNLFLVATGILILTAMVSVSVGYLISVACGSTTLALSVTIPIIIPFLLFGGMFINDDSTPVYFLWLKFSSWYRYAFEMIMVNQWESIKTIRCGNSSVPVGTFQLQGKLPNINADSLNARFCLYRTGKDVLDYFSFDKNDFYFDLGMLSTLLVVFYVAAFIALFIRARLSRR